MDPSASSLLRRLGGGVGPPTHALSAGAPGDRETLDFALLLDQARSGRLRSGIPVRVPDALATGLDDVARERLSQAADAALSEGLSRALVLLGGRMFRLDVGARSVVDAPAPDQAVVAGIDGVVRASADAPSPPGVTHGRIGPARLVRNPSLIHALAGAVPHGP
jgi:hypothetical protein